MLKKTCLLKWAGLMLLFMALTLIQPPGWGMSVAEAAAGGGSNPAGGITLVLKVGDPAMTVNSASKPVDSLGTVPVLADGRVFVPIRAIVEALGGSMDYTAGEQKVTIILGGNTVNLWAGKTSAVVCGRTVALDAVPYISNGRTMIPLRFVAANLGCQVRWDGATRQVTINYGTGNSAPNSELAQETHVNPSFSNDLLKQNIEKLNSYRRKINTVTTDAATGKQGGSRKEFAYVRNPLSRYFKLEFPVTGSYTEEIIIGDKLWNRSRPDQEWTAWDSYETDKPVTFKYDVSTQPYPIDYQKLTFAKAGTEKVNGVNCIKYTVAGSYKDEFSFDVSPQKYPIEVTASGAIWIADDAVIKQAIIRQRITVNADITVGRDNASHIVSKDVIEDDVTDVNSTVIKPPGG